MKKIFIILIIILFWLGVGIIFLRYFPFGTKSYTIPNSSYLLDIPKLSYLKDSNDSTIRFQTFRSISSLQNNFNQILKKYKKVICNNEEFYYDKNNDITIISYHINKGKIFNNFSIEYIKGSLDANKCSIITDSKNLSYQMKYCPEGICYGSNLFHYKNIDGNIYNLYYNNSKDLLFKTGMDKMNFLTGMLHYGWLSMQDVIDFLEYQVQKNNFTKQVDNNQKYILYRNKDFALLLCTTEKNKDIYIENPDFIYTNNICDTIE